MFCNTPIAASNILLKMPSLDLAGTLAARAGTSVIATNKEATIADEMVNMIIAQRAYELNSKAITTSDSMLETANNLKR